MSDAQSSSGDDDVYEDEDYYTPSADTEVDPREADIESYEFECFNVEEIDKFLAAEVNDLNDKLILQEPGAARILLHHFKWNSAEIIERYKKNPAQTLEVARIRSTIMASDNNNAQVCETCYQGLRSGEYRSLDCGHQFCVDCWMAYLEVQIEQGQSTEIACMSRGCDIVTPAEFVLELISDKCESLRRRYLQFSLNAFVNSHPLLRYCPGNDCHIIVKVKEAFAKRVICSECKTQFCFRCGLNYHAPSDCETIKLWNIKCADDSETAHYISAHTKDCPKCHICIEKNGGCNHMQCSGCKHEFCWMCLGDWRSHGSQYYECSRYKENPNVVNVSEKAKAREALNKYLFYYTRWQNHADSLRLEEVTRRKIELRINEKIKADEGTWIEWQYILEAAHLLAKCRYTLQYTYPYAYYLEPGLRKELFEHRQALLEAEIENLSWKLERAETTQRGELSNQMSIAEKRRSTLLKDFLSP